MTYDYEVQTKMGLSVLTNQKFGMWKIVKEFKQYKINY